MTFGWDVSKYNRKLYDIEVRYVAISVKSGSMFEEVGCKML